MKKFLFLLTAIICGAVSAGDEYSFFLISDTHIGSLESFGENPPAKLKTKAKEKKQQSRSLRKCSGRWQSVTAKKMRF